MSDFYDLTLRETSEETQVLASEIGWSKTNCELNTVFIQAESWGELKRKISEESGDENIIVFEGGDADLNRKAAELGSVDIILHPEKGRKDSGIDHIIAEKAAENNTAIGFDLKQLDESSKSQTHVLRHWIKNLELCEKYGTPYVFSSGAENKYQLRAPRDLKSLIDSLGFDGSKAVSEHPKNIVERSS